MLADGNSMSGTMTYAKRSLPLALERAKPATEWAIPAEPAKIAPMATDAKPDVEVATVLQTLLILLPTHSVYSGRCAPL